MPKVCTSAALWPAIRRQVERIIAGLIRAHCAQDITAALAGDRVIPFEHHMSLWCSFLASWPMLEVGFEAFSDELNRALGRSTERRNPARI